MTARRYPLLSQVRQWTGRDYVRVLVDQGYRDHAQLGAMEVIMPGNKRHGSDYALRRHKQLCKRRSAIEAVISHPKSEHKLGRNYLKGCVGEGKNALLADMGFNLMLLVRELAGHFLTLLFCIFFCLEPSRKLYFSTH